MVTQESIKMAIIPVVVEQHAEEAAFLWLLRDSAVTEPHYSLPDVAHLDDRTEAHIDGLRIAGDEGWEICREILAWEEAGEVFTAAVLALESGNKDRIKMVIEAGFAEPELTRGLVSALGWLSYQKAEKLNASFLRSKSPMLRCIGIASSAVHRKDPGKNLTDALIDEDPHLKARALRAVGELGRRDLLSIVNRSINEKERRCCFFAAWSAALLGDLATNRVLKDIVENDGDYANNACAMALRRMSVPEGQSWVRDLWQQSDKQRIAIIGAGVIGDPVSIPWLIEIMGVPELARVAGESFTMITGIDLAYEDLEGEWPEGFEAGPTEEPGDEDVEMDPDEDLAWPEPELIHKWWSENKKNFRNGTRYLCGKPISEQQCQHVLRYGYQRQRAAAAIELVMMKPGQPLFEVRAPGFRQQKLLGLK
jgi:uncharacterized protein (TIGR02270 family)